MAFQIVITKKITYSDTEILPGTFAIALTRQMVQDIKNRQVKWRLEYMRRRYDEKGREGLFAKLEGKWRWVDAEFYVYEKDYDIYS